MFLYLLLPWYAKIFIVVELRKYKEYVAGCKKYGIPFGHYTYCCFISITDAIQEANDFHKRADKAALFFVAGVEE